MTNYENLLSMSVDELCEYLGVVATNCGAMCVHGDRLHGLGIVYDCDAGIKQWLESEVDNGH